MAKPISRSWVTISVCLLVLGLLGLQFVEERASDGRRVGLYLEETDGRLGLVEVLPGDPAERAGLKKGDIILSIGGREVRSALGYDKAATEFTFGQPVAFRVERHGEPQAIEVRPGVPYDWLGFVLNTLAVLLYLSLAGLVFHSGIRDRRVRLLLILLIAIAIELSLPLEQVGFPGLEGVVLPILWLVIGLQFAVELDLASLIPDRHPLLQKAPRVVFLYYAVGLGWGLVMAASEIPALGDSALLSWQSTRAGELSIEAWYLLWPVGLLALLSTAALWSKSQLGRQQALLVLAGVGPWIVLTGVQSLRDIRGLPFSSLLERVEPLVLLFYPLAIFIALYRLHLFRFRMVVRKSVVYSVLVTAVVLGFYGILGGASGLLSSFIEDSSVSIWVVVAASMGMGLAIGPLRRLLEARIENWLFPERMALHQRMSMLARDLRRENDLPKISGHLVRSLTEMFAVERVALLLKESPSTPLVHQSSSHDNAFDLSDRPVSPSERDQLLQEMKRTGKSVVLCEWAGTSALAARLESSGVSLVQPILARRALVGLLLLGSKSGESSFPPEEIELLGLLSHHVATVLEKARLFESATIDGLTGLLRRESILARLETELEFVARYRRPLTVALIDLDEFKQVNDRHGHLVGDLMLQRVAESFSASLRRTDASGRYGGEEFLLVLTETELEGALGVCETLREKVELLTLETESGRSVGVTVSIGLASVEGDSPIAAPSVEELLRAADRSLYAAKHAGRNRVVSLEQAHRYPQYSSG